MKTLAILLSLCLASPAIAPAAAAVERELVQAGAPAASAAAEPITDEEAAELGKRSEHPGKEVAGGALSTLHLTYIVIALAAAVIVLIAVK